ncbi:MAG: sulfotransferase family 2 domain-containing protein [Gammaproteobacteria bacterium]|nr:sulfotransferase family 2 domain-containing protein [Gammaproteobacteria bacterium]
MAPLLRHETRIGSNASMTSMVPPSQLSTASVPHASGNCIGHFYVAKSVRMAYLSIPKSGCTSLINMLHTVAIPGFSTIGTRIHRESTLPRVPAPACPAGLLRFTFVRNPYLRLLSFYRARS